MSRTDAADVPMPAPVPERLHFLYRCARGGRIVTVDDAPPKRPPLCPACEAPMRQVGPHADEGPHLAAPWVPTRFVRREPAGVAVLWCAEPGADLWKWRLFVPPRGDVAAEGEALGQGAAQRAADDALARRSAP